MRPATSRHSAKGSWSCRRISGVYCAQSMSLRHLIIVLIISDDIYDRETRSSICSDKSRAFKLGSSPAILESSFARSIRGLKRATTLSSIIPYGASSGFRLRALALEFGVPRR
jgi:hypothetical protein